MTVNLGANIVKDSNVEKYIADYKKANIQAATNAIAQVEQTERYRVLTGNLFKNVLTLQQNLKRDFPKLPETFLNARAQQAMVELRKEILG
jgi:dTDP-glucose pyrophosphorylase